MLVRKILFHFVVELRKEAGPYADAIHTLTIMSCGHIRKMRDATRNLRSTKKKIAELNRYIERYHVEVVSPLKRAKKSGPLSEESAQKRISDCCVSLEDLVDDFEGRFPSPVSSIPPSSLPIHSDVERTVIAFDLVGYSDKIRARTATNPSGEHSQEALRDVRLINTAIHQHVHDALRDTRVADRTFVAIDGDGGMIQFLDSKKAFEFAENLHRCAHRFNAKMNSKASSHDVRSRRLREYHYRVGASHGWVTINPDVHLQNQPELWRVGLPYYEAARMLADSPEDSIRLVERTYKYLLDTVGRGSALTSGYQRHCDVPGKREETFNVYDKPIPVSE